MFFGPAKVFLSADPRRLQLHYLLFQPDPDGPGTRPGGLGLEDSPGQGFFSSLPSYSFLLFSLRPGDIQNTTDAPIFRCVRFFASISVGNAVPGVPSVAVRKHRTRTRTEPPPSAVGTPGTAFPTAAYVQRVGATLAVVPALAHGARWAAARAAPTRQ